MRFPVRADLATIWALVRRAANELMRVPAAAIPGVLAPTIFFLGINAVFAKLTDLPGFATPNYVSFLIPVSLLQGAAFTGAATGVNLARDIEQGWFDRLLVSPAPRPVLLAGIFLSASLRALVPATLLLTIAFVLGAHWPGIGGLAIALVVLMAMATVAAAWGTAIALRFKTQSAAPLMQAGMLAMIFATTAYAPQALLSGWLADVAPYNPMTQVLETARQGFVGGISWADTWPGFLALAGLLTVLALAALREIRQTAA